jgi:hypothetical protein
LAHSTKSKQPIASAKGVAIYLFLTPFVALSPFDSLPLEKGEEHFVHFYLFEGRQKREKRRIGRKITEEKNKGKEVLYRTIEVN